jgi:FAD/FMN-containing dehydrogenase
MSSKIADYLREHLVGEVSIDEKTLDHFSTDGSIIKLKPRVVIYPQGLQDVRKVLRFCWRLAEKGTILPITMRGSGTDQAGGAIGDGLILVTPSYLDHIQAIDSKNGIVKVEPGLNYRDLQNTIQTHGMFLPPYPSSIDFSTIGGAIANNASGVKSVKYGSTREFVTSLDVVLSNGDTMATGPLSKKELAKKKSLHSFEGEIYRQIDALIQEHRELIESGRTETTKDSTAYALSEVLRDGKTFDLTPLFVGSQGTLGVITAAELQTIPYNPETSLALLGFTKLNDLTEVSIRLRDLQPSALEVVDKHLLNKVNELNPNQLKGLVPDPYPNFVLLVEFDDLKQRERGAKLKKLDKILKEYDVQLIRSSSDKDEIAKIWKIRDSAAIIMSSTFKSKSALPIIEDGCVAPDKLDKLITGIYDLFRKFDLEVAVWGHAGDANLHIEPLLDLGSVGDRQKVFKIMDAYYNLVLSLGGTISGEHNDGRLRTPYMQSMYSPELYQVFAKVKQIFDPYNLLNPGVKFGTTKEDLVHIMRREFTQHWKEHLPIKTLH